MRSAVTRGCAQTTIPDQPAGVASHAKAAWFVRQGLSSLVAVGEPRHVNPCCILERAISQNKKCCRVLFGCAGQVCLPDDAPEMANVHRVASRSPICNRKLQRPGPVFRFAEFCKALPTFARLCRPSWFARRHTRRGKCAPCGLT